MKKYKVLFIGYDDNRLYGHAYYAYSTFSEQLFEKKLVVLYPSTNDTAYSIVKNPLKVGVLNRIVRHLVRAIKSLFSFRVFPIIDYLHAGYRFYDFEAEAIPISLIKEKIGSFVPDIILFYWTDGKISSSIIRGLTEYYKCKAGFVFVDQQYITGGCHFPTDCSNYKKGCISCPALFSGKRLANIQYRLKQQNLLRLNKIIIAPPADLQLAKESDLLGTPLAYINWVLNPDVECYSRMESRAFFKIPDDSFVIMIGAASLSDKRKGIEYAINAINQISDRINNIILLCAGNSTNQMAIHKKINVVNTGWLSRNDLFKAFCASDCFISSSLADSGPIMVNYAVALGVPVISFNIGTAVAIVEHKKTGYIAEYRKSEDIANGICFIHNLSRKEKELFSSRAKELIKEKSSKTVDEELYRILKLDEGVIN